MGLDFWAKFTDNLNIKTCLNFNVIYEICTIWLIWVNSNDRFFGIFNFILLNRIKVSQTLVFENKLI